MALIQDAEEGILQLHLNQIKYHHVVKGILESVIVAREKEILANASALTETESTVAKKTNHAQKEMKMKAKEIIGAGEDKDAVDLDHVIIILQVQHQEQIKGKQETQREHLLATMS